MNRTSSPSQSSSGQLLALLTAGFYALFTLMPDSHSLMVVWPWVLIWQVGLLCPVLWGLGISFRARCFPQLGNNLDFGVGVVIASLIVTTIFAELPHPARWYSWASLCFIVALYTLNDWFDHPERRYRCLRWQGYLSLAFILISLTLWGTQTLFPELDRLEQLEAVGVSVRFDLSVLELRNWAPLGHQNYVAGYLVLALPLLAALAILEPGWRRWLWSSGIGLGLMDLYTTSSRGGWLGLLAVLLTALAIALLRSAIPRIWLVLSALGSVLVVLLFIFANNRLRSLLLALFSGEGGGQFAYRLITMTTGWQMGKSDLLTGVGLGNVPWFYQEYLPDWAGYQAQLIYQLHSTPAQLFAELGLWGVLIQLGAVVLFGYLVWRWFATKLDSTDLIIAGSLFCALFGYLVVSLTDYQLDNVAISGTLVIYLAAIASILRQKEFLTLPSAPQLGLAGLGFTVAVLIWLFPIHRAWQVSSQGFSALAQAEPNWEGFVERLTQAHNLVPWEPYYSYQLGWNLGERALTSANATQRQRLRLPFRKAPALTVGQPFPGLKLRGLRLTVGQDLLAQSINWFEAGLKASRDREFGYTNLGWLQLNQGNPQEATQSFAQSAQLLPAKRGVFYSLGLSLLAHNQTELAVQAFSLEVLRNPIFITSPLWTLPGLQPIYPQVMASAIAQCSELLNSDNLSTELERDLHQIRGSFLWWQGNLAGAKEDLQEYGSPLSQAVLKISAGETVINVQETLSPSPAQQLLLAWVQPEQRSQHLQQAWIRARKEMIPEERLEALLTSMTNAETFESWLKQKAPTWQYRRQRLGFGVNMRHLGGATPSDYFQVVENIPIVVWFNSLFPTSAYFPDLDLALQPQRQALLQQVE